MGTINKDEHVGETTIGGGSGRNDHSKQLVWNRLMSIKYNKISYSEMPVISTIHSEIKQKGSPNKTPRLSQLKATK